MLDKLTEGTKIVFSTFLATIAASEHKYIVLLVILMAVDTIFGWVKGYKLKKWSSNSARWGMIGKIIELMFVGTLYMLDVVFNLGFLKHIGVFYFGICEFASIVENYAEINNNLPEDIPDILKKFQFSIGTVLVNKIKDVISAMFGDKNGGGKNDN